MTRAEALLYWGGVRHDVQRCHEPASCPTEARRRRKRGSLDALILAQLPATSRQVSAATGFLLYSVQCAFQRMERQGRVQCVGVEVRAKIWDVVR